MFSMEFPRRYIALCNPVFDELGKVTVSVTPGKSEVALTNEQVTCLNK